jgi:hypothetical protein
MKKHFVPITAAAMVFGSAASADPFVDAVVQNFRDMGYQYIEIDRGRTQLRAEGVRGDEELEVVYDLATGRIIRRDISRASDEYIGRRGVEINRTSRDFVGDDRSGSGRNDNDDDNDDDDDDDDRSSSSRNDNDDDDDDGDRSSSSRNDNDDDDDDGDRSSSSRSSGSSGSSGSSSNDNDDDNDDDS